MFIFYIITLCYAYDFDNFIPRYNESCASEENAKLCESDCITQYNSCIDQCENQGSFLLQKSCLAL